MVLRSILFSPIRRYFLTKKLFKVAKELAELKGKRLMMIGDPCSGNYFRFMSSFFPNSEHGDVTIDLFGCNSCERMDINDIQSWEKFDNDAFVIMETGVLGFSNDVKSILSHIRRISGGDFFSAGGNKGFLWTVYLYKTYSKLLNYSMNPFDSRTDEYYSGIILGKSLKNYLGKLGDDVGFRIKF